MLKLHGTKWWKGKMAFLNLSHKLYHSKKSNMTYFVRLSFLRELHVLWFHDSVICSKAHTIVVSVLILHLLHLHLEILCTYDFNKLKDRILTETVKETTCTIFLTLITSYGLILHQKLTPSCRWIILLRLSSGDHAEKTSLLSGDRRHNVHKCS